MQYVIESDGLKPLDGGPAHKDEKWSARETDPVHIAVLRTIVREHQYARVRCPVTKRMVGVDAFSASAVVQVYDAINAENRVKYAAFSIRKAADVAFKLVNR